MVGRETESVARIGASWSGSAELGPGMGDTAGATVLVAPGTDLVVEFPPELVLSDVVESAGVALKVVVGVTRIVVVIIPLSVMDALPVMSLTLVTSGA